MRFGSCQKMEGKAKPLMNKGLNNIWKFLRLAFPDALLRAFVRRNEMNSSITIYELCLENMIASVPFSRLECLDEFLKPFRLLAHILGGSRQLFHG